MKYYIILIVTLTLLIFWLSTSTLSQTARVQKLRNDYIVNQYRQVVLERDRAVSGLTEIQDRVNAVREALK